MNIRPHWRKLGWRHGVWDLVRYYRSLRREGEAWVTSVKNGEFDSFPVLREHILLLEDYVLECQEDLEEAFGLLRDEEDAVRFCGMLGAAVEKTRTQTEQHHQSAKALVAAVTHIASIVSHRHKVPCVPNPQRRIVWFKDKNLHVTARNLDGAVPSLENPYIVWEIKEYWGKTKGGSKMSDALYECNLVGLDLRHFEERSRTRVVHAVFLDGRAQWQSRRSDMTRFLDLFHQGIIDFLFVGRDVQEKWERYLDDVLRNAGV